MKIAACLICFAAAGICQPEPQRPVTVCMEAFGSTLQARHVASRIFAEIGVHLDWRMEARGCPEHAIQIQIATTAPATLRPGALAYARPYADSSIVVFHDRVAEHFPHDNRLIPALLGHVLAHEIAHIIQRMDRHSESGVMKACWKGRDFLEMARTRLRFDTVDAVLIHEGLDARRSEELVATHAP